jgi:hypothetical protein
MEVMGGDVRTPDAQACGTGLIRSTIQLLNGNPKIIIIKKTNLVPEIIWESKEKSCSLYGIILPAKGLLLYARVILLFT